MRVQSVNISLKKGEKKNPTFHIKLVPNHGVEGDAHAGDWHRQVSLLGMESIEKMKKLGADVSPGDFAENITTEGIELASLPIGARLRIGDDALIELTQIGKECHSGCAIMKQVGTCVMPKEGVFFIVIVGGTVRPGDPIAIVDQAGD